MSYALKIYEAFKDDEERARVLSEAFDELEKRYPHIGDIATVQHLENERLRLQNEMETNRLELTKEIEKVRLDLTKEIEKVRLDVEKVRVEQKETELKLTKEIEKVKLDLTKEIMEAKQSILKWLFGFWVTQATFVIGVIWVLLKVQ